MKLYLVIILASLFLISCESVKPDCGGKVAGGGDGANGKSLNSKKRFSGYNRVPVSIPDLHYPRFAVAQKQEAEIVVKFDINQNGNVINASIQSNTGSARFNSYALQYIENYKFKRSSCITRNALLKIVYKFES